MRNYDISFFLRYSALWSSTGSCTAVAAGTTVVAEVTVSSALPLPTAPTDIFLDRERILL